MPPDKLVGFKLRHLKNVRQHVESAAMCQLSQFRDSFGNQIRGFDRTSIPCSWVGRQHVAAAVASGHPHTPVDRKTYLFKSFSG